MSLLFALAVLAAALLITGGVWSAHTLRSYRFEADRRRARAFASLTAAVEEARQNKERDANIPAADPAAPGSSGRDRTAGEER